MCYTWASGTLHSSWASPTCKLRLLRGRSGRRSCLEAKVSDMKQRLLLWRLLESTLAAGWPKRRGRACPVPDRCHVLIRRTRPPLTRGQVVQLSRCYLWRDLRWCEVNLKLQVDRRPKQQAAKAEGLPGEHGDPEAQGSPFHEVPVPADYDGDLGS